MSIELPLLWMMLTEILLAAAVLVGGIYTVRPWFSSSAIFLS